MLASDQPKTNALKESERGRFISMTLGAACFICFSFMVASGDVSRFLGFHFVNIGGMIAYATILITFFFALPALAHEKIRKAISLALVALSLIWGILVLTCMEAHTIPSMGMQYAISVLGLSCNAILIVQWNLHFALNRIENLGLMIWGSVLAAIVLLLLFLNTGFDIPFAAVCLLLPLSGLCSLWLESEETSNAESKYSITRTLIYDEEFQRESRDTKRAQILLFASRILWGLGYGLAFSLLINDEGSAPGNTELAGYMAVFALACIVAAVSIGRKASLPSFCLIMLPILIVGMIVPVFLHSEIAFLARLSGGIAWLAWYVQSYAQLPSYRRIVGVDAVRFAYMEKLCALVPWVAVSMLVMMLQSQSLVFANFSRHVDVGVIVFMCVLVAFSVIAIARHIALYYPHAQTYAMAGKEGRASHSDRLLSMAQTYMLTDREQDVLFYLAYGYSRPYIEKSLYISQGTARTHIRHIYSKLGVSSQDELLELFYSRNSSNKEK